MKLSGNTELKITNDALKYAKIISSPIDDEKQRKRAFASIVALDAFADFLVTQGITVNISKSLFKIAPLNAEYEISDVYYNNWKFDIRIVTDEDFVTIPKSHYKNDITPDMYVILKVEKNLSKARLLGYIEPQNVDKTIDTGAYYISGLKALSSTKEFIEKIKTEKETTTKDSNHFAFQNNYLSYLENTIDSFTKKTFIKHLSNCQECRCDFVEFFDFESIVKNLTNKPEFFEDKTLTVISGQETELPEYSEVEEEIVIFDNDTEEDTILSELFDDKNNGMFFNKNDDEQESENDDENNNDDNGNTPLATVASAGVMGTAAVLGVGLAAGAAIGSATSGPDAMSKTIDVAKSGLDLASNTAELLTEAATSVNQNSPITMDSEIRDELKLDVNADEETDLLFEDESIDNLEIDNLDYESDLDNTVQDSVEELESLDDIEHIEEAFLTEEAPIEDILDIIDEIDTESTVVEENGLQNIEDQVDEHSSFEELSDELPDFDENDTNGFTLEFADEDDYKHSQSEDFEDINDASEGEIDDKKIDDLILQENIEHLKLEEEIDAILSTTDENLDENYDDINFTHDLSEITLAETESFIESGELDDIELDLPEINMPEELLADYEIEEETTEDGFLTPYNYSNDPASSTLEEENKENPEEESEEKDDETLLMDLAQIQEDETDNNIDQDLSEEPTSIVDEESSFISQDNEQYETDEDNDAESDDEFKEFINAGNEMQNEQESDSEELIENTITLSPQSDFENDEDSDEKEINLLYENGTVANPSSEDESGEQIEYMINKPDGLSILKDKKTIIITSCVLGCLLMGSVFGIALHAKSPKNQDGQESLTDQLQENMPAENAIGGLETISSESAEDPQMIARESSANVHKDMDKVMSNVFDENPSTVAVTKISWEVNQSLAKNEAFAKYLQIAGKNLQINLKNDLINATEFTYNDHIKLQILMGEDNKIRKVDVLNTSGSEQIDQIVLQSIKETLKYINVPQLSQSMPEVSGGAAKQGLIGNHVYDLRLVINF